MAKKAKTAAPKKKAAAKKPAKVKVDLPKTINEIGLEFSALNEEIEKFNGGNKSSGRRARKALQNLRKLAGQARKEIQEIVSTM